MTSPLPQKFSHRQSPAQYRFFACLLVIFIVFHSQAAFSLTPEQEDFLQAEKALKQGNILEFRTLKQRLKAYPLYPYLEYADIKKHLGKVSPARIRKFVEKYADSPLSGFLKNRWLRHLAKKKKWQDYLDFYEKDAPVKLQCLHARALLETGRQTTAWPFIKQLWLHGRSRPSECDYAFNQWMKNGHLTKKLRWHRVSLALQANQIKLARFLGKTFRGEDKVWFRQWLDIRKNPDHLLHQKVSARHPYRNTVLEQGITRLARKDLERAFKLWEQLRHSGSFSSKQISRVERSLSLRLLDKPSPDTFDRLVFMEPCDEDTKLQEIRIRAALLNGKWEDLLHLLENLPPEHINKDRWVYWRARSLEKTGQQSQAMALYKTISAHRSYYGFLAADKLQLPYQMNHSELSIDELALEEIRQLPAIKRAHELLQLNRNLEARREWFLSTMDFDTQELLAASQLAHQWGWHDRAILTIARAKYWDDLDIRFPLKYKQLVLDESRRTAIDPAWIYAMIRQESAFMQDANSGVGALGLMQLMPSTAKHMAKTLKQRKPARQDLFTPKKNIRLGTAYLDQVYKQLNQNPVLAIAAYNAGPHRVKKWLPDTDMPADIWIELIPYKETRKYLKSILAYTVIYEHKLGTSTGKMTDRMPLVQASEKATAARVALNR